MPVDGAGGTLDGVWDAGAGGTGGTSVFGAGGADGTDLDAPDVGEDLLNPCVFLPDLDGAGGTGGGVMMVAVSDGAGGTLDTTGLDGDGGVADTADANADLAAASLCLLMTLWYEMFLSSSFWIRSRSSSLMQSRRPLMILGLIWW